MEVKYAKPRDIDSYHHETETLLSRSHGYDQILASHSLSLLLREMPEYTPLDRWILGFCAYN